MAAEWLLLTRDPDGALSGPMPVRTLTGFTRHIGVGTGAATVRSTPKALQRLSEGAGVVLHRDGEEMCTGNLGMVEDAWPDNSIAINWVSEQEVLADRLVLPNPAASAADQNVAAWTASGSASTVMRQLIADQLGSGAHADWRVPGLTLGPDPMVGAVVSESIRYGAPDLMAELKRISIASGVDLGVRVKATASGPLVSVVAPVDSTGIAKFSADLRNLDSYRFARKAPTVTDVIVAGKPYEMEPPPGGWPPGGEPSDEEKEAYRLTHPRQVLVSSTDPITLAWRRRIVRYKTESTVTEIPELIRSGQDDLDAGAAGVTLVATLRDTNRLRFGRDWQLGHRVTVGVGRPGQEKTEVVDVVREVKYELGPDGESITPCIGSPDSSSLPTLPTRQALNLITAKLAGLERSR